MEFRRFWIRRMSSKPRLITKSASQLLYTRMQIRRGRLYWHFPIVRTMILPRVLSYSNNHIQRLWDKRSFGCANSLPTANYGAQKHAKRDCVLSVSSSFPPFSPNDAFALLSCFHFFSSIWHCLLPSALTCTFFFPSFFY